VSEESEGMCRVLPLSQVAHVLFQALFLRVCAIPSRRLLRPPTWIFPLCPCR
jgi:hypothetical protein